MAKTQQDSPSDDAVGEKISTVERAATKAVSGLNALSAARSTSRIVRYAGLGVIVIVLVFGLYALYSSVANLMSDKGMEEMGNELEIALQESAEQFQQRMASDEGRAQRMLQNLSDTMLGIVDDVKPAFMDALTDKFKGLGEQVSRTLEQQVERLKENVRARLYRQLDEALSGVEARARSAMLRAMPRLEAQGELVAQIVGGLREGFKQWVAHELETTLAGHLDALADIRTTLLDLHPGEDAPRVNTEQLLGLWLEVVYEEMGGDGLLQGSPEPEAPAPEATP